ncbi:ATP-binding protein [Streptomyces sp. NPDC023327]|uniref:ATP-binding protein n=1 Tax=Streptomyces sp. NPDC023327 TaxID=3157088 RepID=UPI00340A2DA8
MPASPAVSSRIGWTNAYDSAANETLTLIVAELTANAVRGRDFLLRLTATSDTLRVEVTSTRTERVPPRSVPEAPSDAESGRRLPLVARLATAWGTDPRPDAPGKTVWAELSPGPSGTAMR